MILIFDFFLAKTIQWYHRAERSYFVSYRRFWWTGGTQGVSDTDSCVLVSRDRVSRVASKEDGWMDDKNIESILRTVNGGRSCSEYIRNVLCCVMWKARDHY